NLLSKFGIITLVLGIGLFGKSALDQDWVNETGRVGIGLLTGVAIICMALKLKNSMMYSRLYWPVGLCCFLYNDYTGFP
ncbi:MAG: hypothetical protein LIP01_01175, partial [Tannerellaceae bacterium]|nr:hypothetical protein [Tannerellaceae bacterium]